MKFKIDSGGQTTNNNSNLLLRECEEENNSSEIKEENYPKSHEKAELRYDKQQKEILQKKMRKSVTRTGAAHNVKRQSFVIKSTEPALKELEESKQKMLASSITVNSFFKYM